MSYIKINRFFLNNVKNSNKKLEYKFKRYYFKGSLSVDKNKIYKKKYFNKHLENYVNKWNDKESKLIKNFKIKIVNLSKIKKLKSKTINPELSMVKKKKLYIIKNKNLINNKNKISYNNNTNYDEINKNISKEYDYLKLLLFNKYNLNKKDILIIQFEGILGEFFYNIKLFNGYENKKYKLKKNSLGILNNLTKFIIKLSKSYTIFFIINNKTYENEYFKIYIYNKIKRFIGGFFELIKVHINSIILKIDVIKKIINTNYNKITFMLCLNYDYNKNKQIKFELLKKFNFKLIDKDVIKKVIYVKNWLFDSNNKFNKINDSFFKINNNFLSKLTNTLINNIDNDFNKFLNILDFKKSQVSDNSFYDIVLSGILKNNKFQKYRKIPSKELDNELILIKTNIYKFISDNIDNNNQKYSIIFDFLNRNSSLIKKIILNSNDKINVINKFIDNNKNKMLKNIKYRNNSIKEFLNYCFIL